MSTAKRALLRTVLVLSLVAVIFVPASAWWDTGHMLINRAAAEKATALPPFFRADAEHIAYMGPEPDRWRQATEFSLKNSQEPDHFIDLERVADIAKLPEGRYDFIRLLYAKRVATKDHGDDFLPEKVGLQPYITMEVYGRLKVAMREYRRLQAANQSTADIEQNIVLYAGWLGHYVGDGANPLHTTIQYNGWVGDNPNGYTTSKEFHAQFEGRFVQANVDQLGIGDLVHDPVRLQNPFEDYVNYLRDSNKLVEKTYQLEKTGAFAGKGTAEGREFVRQRLAAGAQMLLNLWYTAWVESEQAIPPYHPSK
jgi:hypothetical protein